MSNTPSVPAGSHEMQDHYSNQDPPRSSPHIAPSITPYLGLRSRLSQIWINRWTVLLLLVLAQILIAISGINSDLDSARREALSACSNVESLGSAMASMPHYMSQGANELAAKGVEKAVNGLTEMTLLSATGVEEIVVFVVDMMTSTYACLISMAVNGTIGSGINVIEQAQGFLTTDIQTIGGDINTALQEFLSAYDTAVNDVKSAVGAFGTSVTFPNITLESEQAALSNLKLPTDLTPLLDKIKADLPTFAQVQNATNSAIRAPFEFVKSEIQTHLGNYTFDRSVFPVPAKEELTFCSDSNGIGDFFDELVHLVAIAKTIFIGVLVAAAILVCIPMAWREIKRWRTMQERSRLVQLNAHDPMDVVYTASRPYTSTAGIKVANNFNSTRRQILTRWVFAYATSDAALFVLFLAFAGFFFVACQIILLKTLEKEVPDLTNQVEAFADKVIARLTNASEFWAIGTNGAVNTLSKDINNQMVGWVNITTGALNDTLNTFVDETILVLNETFAGTSLYTPILDVLNCLVLLKVAGIEKGLTWVSENAHVDFPAMPTDLFSVGAIASIASNNSNPSDSFLSAPGDDATDEISAVLDRFLSKLQNAIRTEALVAAVILCVWLFIVLIGVIRALTLWYGREKTRGEGGDVDARAGLNLDEFQDIPQGTANANIQSYMPEPKYTTTPEGELKYFSASAQDTLDNEKLGFAGQRDYNTTVSRISTGTRRGRIVSNHAEVWDYRKT
jgi:hypothetical protein